MDKGVEDLISESRDKRAKRTGDRTPASDYQPIQRQGGMRGTLARFLFGKSNPSQPSPPKQDRQAIDEVEPEPQAEKSSGISFSQDKILRGKEIHDTSRFKRDVMSKLRGTSLKAGQRSSIFSSLKSKRSGGLTERELNKTLREAQKSGEITKSQARSIKRKFK